MKKNILTAPMPLVLPRRHLYLYASVSATQYRRSQLWQNYHDKFCGELLPALPQPVAVTTK